MHGSGICSGIRHSEGTCTSSTWSASSAHSSSPSSSSAASADPRAACNTIAAVTTLSHPARWRAGGMACKGICCVGRAAVQQEEPRLEHDGRETFPCHVPHSHPYFLAHAAWLASQKTREQPSWAAPLAGGSKQKPRSPMLLVQPAPTQQSCHTDLSILLQTRLPRSPMLVWPPQVLAHLLPRSIRPVANTAPALSHPPGVG